MIYPLNAGRREDTAVVLTADHGWGLGEHNHWIKYTTWETDTRVPMIIRVPWKDVAGKRTAALVEHVDLYPSLAAIVGVPVDKTLESIDGESWARLLDEPAGQHKDAVSPQPIPTIAWLPGMCLRELLVITM